jgi:hypothetical protein
MKVFGITLIVLAAAVLSLHFAGEYIAADMCLDHGQVYDYGTSQCRADVDHLPYIPYAKRFSWFIAGSLVVLLLGIVCVVIGKRKNHEGTF